MTDYNVPGNTSRPDAGHDGGRIQVASAESLIREYLGIQFGGRHQGRHHENDQEKSAGTGKPEVDGHKNGDKLQANSQGDPLKGFPAAADILPKKEAKSGQVVPDVVRPAIAQVPDVTRAAVAPVSDVTHAAVAQVSDVIRPAIAQVSDVTQPTVAQVSGLRRPDGPAPEVRAAVPAAPDTSTEVAKPIKPATMADLNAAMGELSIKQVAYASATFLKLPSDQSAKLKAAFMGMDGSKLVSVAKSFSQLDASNLKRTLELLGGANPEQLKSITNWMQNPQKLDKMGAALKETSSDEFGKMNSEDFFNKLKSKIEPTTVAKVETAEPERKAETEERQSPEEKPVEKKTEKKSARENKLTTVERPDPENNLVTVEEPAPENKLVAGEKPAPENKLVAVEKPAPENKLVAVEKPAPENKLVTVEKPAPENKLVTVEKLAPENNLLTIEKSAPENNLLTIEKSALDSTLLTIEKSALESKLVAVDKPAPESKLVTVERPAPENRPATIVQPAPENKPATIVQPAPEKRVVAKTEPSVVPPRINSGDTATEAGLPRRDNPVRPKTAPALNKAEAADPMVKMMANLTDAQKQEITPEVMEKGLQIMKDLKLKPGDLQKLAEKFSGLMTADKSGKGFQMALYAITHLTSAQLQPILDCANELDKNDVNAIKSLSSGMMPSNPKKLIDRLAKMKPEAIQHECHKFEDYLDLYEQIPGQYRWIARAVARSYAPRF